MNDKAPEARPHTSPSSLKSFMACPKADQLRRVVRVPEDPSYALAGGRAVHKATFDADRDLELQDRQQTVIESS